MMYHIIRIPVRIYLTKSKFQSHVSTTNKVTGILFLCIAITSMPPGSSAWYDIQNSEAVDRQATIHNNHMNRLVQLLRWNIEKDLHKFLEGINLQKTPLKGNDKLGNEDVNECENNQFSFDLSHRINTGRDHGQRWIIFSDYD